MIRNLLILVGVVALFTGVALGQTVVPGGPVQGIWTSTGSPYLIMGEINIPSASYLLILPNVDVIFLGHYKFIVNGLLQATGTQTASILFTAADTLAGWHGLRFMSAPMGCQLSYCTIQYGKATGANWPDYAGGGIFCTNSNPLISHCTISNNSALDTNGGGGAISCDNANPTIDHCTIRYNAAGSAGGIGCWNSRPEIRACSLYANTVGLDGGAIHLSDSSNALIDSCNIFDNLANSGGGGIFCASSVPTISHCTIRGNWTTVVNGGGGGINCWQANPIIYNCLIDSNSSYFGGGISCGSSNPTITNCTIRENFAENQGSGLLFNGCLNATVENDSITHNIAGWGGGGICCWSSNPTITSCYVAYNEADSSSGGMHLSASNPVITNCTFHSNNSGAWGGAMAIFGNSHPLIDSCLFAINQNRNGNGGAIMIYEADATITHCTFAGNIAQWGGGINCGESQNSVISNSIFTNNWAVSGGGIQSFNADPTINLCDFILNEAEVIGGGAHFEGSSGPLVSFCLFDSNSAANSGGGIACQSFGSHLINCEIKRNHAPSGGGIVASSTGPTIDSCSIHENSADNGGGIYLATSVGLIRHTIINGNSATAQGGGLYLTSSNTLITNCTLHGNTAALGGGIYLEYSNPMITNTNVAGSLNGSGFYFGSLNSPSITYCDIYNSTNFFNPPPGLGIINQTNYNGDPCDAFFNILLNPLFYATTGDSAFYLTRNSPCIDAGDPTSPLDPDNTVADIGAFYFEQNPIDISVTLTPVNPPILIPASGGSFNYVITVTNEETTAQTFEGWIMVRLPSLTWYDPVLGPLTLTLPGSTSISRNRTQSVPGSAPPGVYLYEARVGEYPDDLWDYENFQFIKLGGNDNPLITDWLNSGEDFTRQIITPVSVVPSEFNVSPPHPNPFNATTVIRYQIPDARNVSLRVYDTAGRLVATLVDGWRPAGSHHVTFDGSSLPSGIYIYRLTAGNFNDVGKMVLLK